MTTQSEFTKLLEKLKTERDELKLKLHLGTMEVKGEFEAAEKRLEELRQRGTKIVDEASEVSDEYVEKAKVVGEELYDAYKRIAERLSK